MKKALSLCLLLLLFATQLSLMISCTKEPTTPEAPKEEEEQDTTPTIQMPPYKFYEGKSNLSLSDISYAYPDVPALTAALDGITAHIKEEKAPAAVLISLRALEDSYQNYFTMYSLARVAAGRDPASDYFRGQLRLLATQYPDVVGAVARLLTAVAGSEHAATYEAEYFGADALEAFTDGIVYTDRMIALLKEEAALECDYNDLSLYTVSVTVGEETDTAWKLLEKYKSKYGATSTEYLRKELAIESAYRKKTEEESTRLYIALLKVRKQLAEEGGFATYTDFVFAAEAPGYTQKEYALLSDKLSADVTPVYKQLYQGGVFSGYQGVTKAEAMAFQECINRLSALYAAQDASLYEGFAYMLQYGLYDISATRTGSYSEDFAAYIDGKGTPFLYVTAADKSSDLLTLARTYGVFYGSYRAGEAIRSASKRALYALGTEALTLSALKGQVSDATYQYLKYSLFERSLNTLINRGLYAEFETLVYALPAAQIDQVHIEEMAAAAAATFGFEGEPPKLHQMLLPALITEPLSIQGEVVATVNALELYFKECAAKGTGFTALSALVAANATPDYAQTVEQAGLSSPFAADTLCTVADAVFYDLTGVHFSCGEKNPPSV